MIFKHILAMLGKYDPTTRSVPILAATTNVVEGSGSQPGGEAIESWDLTRFAKNPVILWGHDAFSLPVGLAKDVAFTPGVGLSMTVTFGSEKANPLAEQLASCVQEGLVRAVSVGYNDSDGVAELNEVSFVSVGADEDAGTPHIDPTHPDNGDVMMARGFKPGDKAPPFEKEDGGKQKALVTQAARVLGLHRARAIRARSAQGATNVDAFQAFETSIRDQQRLDAGKAHVVEEHKPDGSVVSHSFGTKSEASSVGMAMRTTNSSVYVHPANSPFVTKDAKQATPAETNAAAASAHAATAAAHSAAGNSKQAEEHTAKAAAYGAKATGTPTPATGGHTFVPNNTSPRAAGAQLLNMAAALSKQPTAGAAEKSSTANSATLSAARPGRDGDQTYKGNRAAAEAHTDAARAATDPADKAHHEAMAAAHTAAAETKGGRGASAIAATQALAPIARAHEDSKTAGDQPDKSGGDDKAAGGGGGGSGQSRDENGRFDDVDVVTEPTSPSSDQRMDAADVLHLDRNRLGKAIRTSLGGAMVPAMLGRTGVLLYINPDGTKRRELRLASEVFKADSLATLDHVPVIDIKDHTALITPETWRKVSLGHVSNAKKDGNFIAGQLVIQDKATLDAIESGERTEISCGYRCRLDWTAGVFEGQEYDCIQRDIRYNHAALCPPNRGRAGPEVGLRLDHQEQAWAYSHFDEQENIMKVVIIDGHEYVVGSGEHIAKLEAMAKASADKIKLDAAEEVKSIAAKHAEELKGLQTRLDKAEAERDEAKAALEKETLDAKERSAKAKAKADEDTKLAAARKRFRRHLERSVALFRKAFGADPDEKDDEKMDAMDDRELMLYAIKLGAPNFDAKDKSDDYVTARFDSMVERVQGQGNPNGIDSIVRAGEAGLEKLNTDANEGTDGNDPVSKARKERDKFLGGLGRHVPAQTAAK